VPIAIVKRPLEEPHCGDQADFWESDGRTVLCIIDGLGHREGAEEAALAALDFVGRHHHEPLLDVFASCDKAVRHTRGVAMGIAVIDQAAGMLTYAGIGNTRAMISGNGKRNINLSSNYGIVGGGYRGLVSESVPLAPGDLVLLYTDGFPEIIDLSAYDDEIKADVERLAETILDDWRRGTDDAAILVFRREAR